MLEEGGEERPLTPSRRRQHGPLLRSQSRLDEIRLACCKGDLASLEQLLKGDNAELVNQAFEDGWTPLMIVGSAGNSQAVKFLLLQGADPNLCRASDGFSPLMAVLTSSKGRVLVQQCAQILIDAGANVNARSKDGCISPILLAVKDNRVPIVDLLVFHGADLNVKDKNGRTPLQLASEKGLDQVLLTLEKREEEMKVNSGQNVTRLNGESESRPETASILKPEKSEQVQVPKLQGRENSAINNGSKSEEPNDLASENSKPAITKPQDHPQKEMKSILQMRNGSTVSESNISQKIAPEKPRITTVPVIAITPDAEEIVPEHTNRNGGREFESVIQSNSNPPMSSSIPESSSSAPTKETTPKQKGANNFNSILQIGVILGLISSVIGIYFSKGFRSM